MRFPRFHRRDSEAPPPPGPPVQTAAGAYCFLADCGRVEGWQCSYVDAAGHACISWWCPEHAVLVNGLPFCRRHAGVAGLLLSRAGSLFELPLPRVEDRALPLLLRLTEQLDARAVHLLEFLYRDRRDVTLAKHANVRERRQVGRHDGWEAMWTATTQSGYLTTITLRVTGAEPPCVILLRDGSPLFDAVPDWIARERADSWHPDGDASLVEELYAILLASFRIGQVEATG